MVNSKVIASHRKWLVFFHLIRPTQKHAKKKKKEEEKRTTEASSFVLLIFIPTRDVAGVGSSSQDE